MAMNTNPACGLTLLALLLTTASTTHANDIVNFLNALNGNSGRRNAPVVVQPIGNHGHEHGGAAYDHQGHGGHGPRIEFGSSGTHRPSFNTVNLRPNHYGAPPVRRSSGLQVSLQFGADRRSSPGYGSPVYVPAPRPGRVLPPVTVYPTVPTFPHVAPVRFQLGQFIDCQVPLATCVQVQDECNKATIAGDENLVSERDLLESSDTSSREKRYRRADVL